MAKEEIIEKRDAVIKEIQSTVEVYEHQVQIMNEEINILKSSNTILERRVKAAEIEKMSMADTSMISHGFGGAGAGSGVKRMRTPQA